MARAINSAGRQTTAKTNSGGVKRKSGDDQELVSFF